MSDFEKLLTDEQKKNLSSSHGILVVNGDRYYYKYCDNFRLKGKSIPIYGVEELMEELAKSVGINSAHYELANIDGSYYTFSKEISPFFDTGEKLGIEAHSLYNIWNELEKKKYNNTYDLMLNFIRMYLFDLLFLNGDRESDNWGIVSEKGNAELYILDNEFSFDDFYPPQLTAHPEDDYYSHKGGFYAMYGDESNTCSSELYLEELEYFLNGTGKEYTEVFMDMYNKLTPEFVYEKILEIEENNNKKMPHLHSRLNIYEGYYKEISKLLNNKKKK